MTGFRVDADSGGAVYLSGELDMATAEGFVDDVRSKIDSPSVLVLDAVDLSFIDSAGIRALVELSEAVRPMPVVVRWPRRNVAQVLDIVEIEALGITVERRPAQT